MRRIILGVLTLVAIAACPGQPWADEHCFDGVKNGRETDVDCGGAGSCRCPPGTPFFACWFGGVWSCLQCSCPPCEDGKDCNTGADCESHRCRPNSLIACALFRQCGGTCAPPTCSDHVQNGSETGIDCGGTCPPCAGTTPPRCDDGVQNGNETGVDCGGSCPVCSCQQRGKCTMFVTSTSQSGAMGGLAGADGICNGLAQHAGLPGRYQAWLCDGVTAPIDRSLHATVPYVRTDGGIIARGWTDLTDGFIDLPINRDEFGNDVSTLAPFLPWTNVTTSGACDRDEYVSPGSGPCPAFSKCPLNCADDGANNGWTTSSLWAQGAKGDVNFTDHNWTDSVTGLCSVPPERIYCIEQ
jgi:hypothetical protein